MFDRIEHNIKPNLITHYRTHALKLTSDYGKNIIEPWPDKCYSNYSNVEPLGRTGIDGLPDFWLSNRLVALKVERGPIGVSDNY